jgi:5'-nucleotidase (lipoprotein e(P4) family)
MSGRVYRYGSLLPAIFLLVSCSKKPQEEVAAHELLNATSWVQTSAEFAAVAMQAYRIAEEQVERALYDPAWTAAQEQTGDFADLLPAVILDVDETVLDNSSYEARTIREKTVFTSETWDLWVEEARAKAIPGALEFCEYAASRGVTVFYVTNRQDHLKEATRRNLKALGFPLWTHQETIFTRTDNSDKGPRRAAIAREYRILLLVGDDARDFSSEFVGRTYGERHMLRTKFNANWGKKWIVLPNPMYGDWERVLYGEEGYRLSPAQRVDRKLETLRY